MGNIQCYYLYHHFKKMNTILLTHLLSKTMEMLVSDRTQSLPH